MFDWFCAEALGAFDRIVGFDVSDICVDGSVHKAPCGGPGTGKSSVDRGKLGWKWSIATERHGISVGWAAAGANRNDSALLAFTLVAVADTGLVADIEPIHLDRGYDGSPAERINSWLSNYGQLRRNTDRKPDSRHAALHLIDIIIIITAKLIDRRNQWDTT